MARYLHFISRLVNRLPHCMNKLRGNMFRSKSGFTLIEAVIVIAIVGILAAIAVPGWLSYRNNSKLRGVTSDLKGDLEMAKLTAIRENRSVVVSFALDGSGYLIFVDDDGSWTFDAGENRERNVQYIAGVISDTDFNNKRFRFDSRGLPVDEAGISSGTVTITRATGNTFIQLNRLGRVQVQW